MNKQLIIILLLLINLPFNINAQETKDDFDATLIAAEGQESKISYNLGIENFKNKEYEEAIKNFSRAIQYEPGFAKAYLNRGSVKTKINDYTGAIEDFNLALQLDTNLTKSVDHENEVKVR